MGEAFQHKLLLKQLPVMRKAPHRTRSKLDSSNILAAAAKGCAGCPLNHAPLIHPKMKPTGAKHPLIYIMGEAPGEEEDKRGEQFVGKTGRILREEIPKEWLDSIRWNNTIRCRPPNNRDPAPIELACCRKQQEEDIAKAKPKLILGFGNVPLNWMLRQGKISAWRGRLVPVKVAGHTCWYMPIYHPSYVMRSQYQDSENAKKVEEAFQDDIAKALKIASRLVPPEIEDASTKDKGVILLPCNLKKVLDSLKEAREWKEVGFDLETKPIRPFASGAKILTCSFSNYERTYAFPYLHREATWSGDERKAILSGVFEMLRRVKPIAHNSKFEQGWLAYFGGDKFIHEIDWQDTMAQAYVLDEREGAKGLDSVSMQAIGINVKSLSPRLNMADLDSEPLSRVLPYNAYDSKYLPPIFMVLEERLEAEGLLDVYELMNCRAGPIALAEQAGVVPDSEMAAKLKAEWDKKVEAAEDAIQKDKDVRKYVKKHGKFKPTSNVDLPALLHDQLGFKECEVGKKVSTDEKVLKQIDHPVANRVLDLRGAKKLVGTYLVPLTVGGKNIWPDGLVHTNYNHLLVSTGRLSSDDPNLQNFPRKEIEIRRVIKAPKGTWMAAFDQGQIEARGIAWHSKDKTLTDALWEKYDIHGEWGRRIALAYPRRIGGKKFLSDKAVMKDFRQETKNKWVFPLFYGSALKSVAEGLNIPSDALSPVYDDFWEMFEGVLAWQKRLRKSYERLGYVATLTGRRRHGPLSWNDIINSPIQGVAADIVCDAMVILTQLSHEEDKPQWQWRMNIHDDLTFYLPDKTIDNDLEPIAKVMIQPRYNFITTPLVVEVKVGKNWCDLEEVETFSSVQYGHKRNSE